MSADPSATVTERRAGTAPHPSSPTDGPRPGHRVPTLVDVVELVHEATAHQEVDLVVVSAVRNGTVDVGVWPIDPAVDHPTEALIGWRPPTWAQHVGLVTSGRAVSATTSEPVRITVMVGTDGEATTVLERGGHPPETLTEPPVGWGADALHRCLGLPTPAPDHGLGSCVEASWLEGIAEALWCEGSAAAPRPLAWPEVALLHPLHPHGPTAAPSELSVATATLEAESSWDRMLQLFARSPRPHSSDALSAAHPPVGRAVPLHEWFDAGSFARWSARRQGDPHDLLFEVLDELPEPVGLAVIDALVSIT